MVYGNSTSSIKNPTYPGKQSLVHTFFLDNIFYILKFSHLRKFIQRVMYRKCCKNCQTDGSAVIPDTGICYSNCIFLYLEIGNVWQILKIWHKLLIGKFTLACYTVTFLGNFFMECTKCGGEGLISHWQFIEEVWTTKNDKKTYASINVYPKSIILFWLRKKNTWTPKLYSPPPTIIT